MALLQFTDKGIYCAQGDFYIDPWKPVPRAVITHAHADHARWGSAHYLAHHDAAPILYLRLGKHIQLQTVGYGEKIYIQGVELSLHPAGHIIGSAQIRVAYGGEVWVASGDYKVENDGISTPFEPIPCHTFITECTFGLPIYKWQPQAVLFNELHQWWEGNKKAGRQSLITAYSLGKAQRIIAQLSDTIGPVWAHTAIYNTQQAFIDHGLPLKPVQRWHAGIDKAALQGALIIAPPSEAEGAWSKRFEPLSVGICSGWMQIRGAKRRRNADLGLALSDHADWPGLLSAVKATGAETVITTHGATATFARYLNEIGIHARDVITEYGNDQEEPAPASTNEIDNS